MNRQRVKGCALVNGIEHTFKPLVPPQVFMVNDGLQAEEAMAEDPLVAHRDARQLVRLVQCPRCSRPLKAPVTLPCSHTVCRKCLPEPQPRTNISYPNTPDRLMGIACPLMGCGAEQPQKHPHPSPPPPPHLPTPHHHYYLLPPFYPYTYISRICLFMHAYSQYRLHTPLTCHSPPPYMPSKRIIVISY